ncbi:MAG: LuxR C-terminal-related transcriptional regulator [Pseudomonadota bacterium]
MSHIHDKADLSDDELADARLDSKGGRAMPKPAAISPKVPKVWFSRSKTKPPSTSIDLVSRYRLIKMLNAGLERSITYLVAPAGYGKSILLTQWREQLVRNGMRCAWLNLEESDREIRQFLAYLVIALDEAGIDVGELKDGAERGFANMSTTVIGANILSLIENVRDRFVLVLDDFHRAKSEDIDDFVHAMQMQCSEKVHIVLVSRNWVGSEVSQLIASGNAIEIQARELRFSDSEVCKALGDAIAERNLAELQEKVEGWPVAVQMTRLLGEQRGDLQAAISSLKGNQGHMAEYLVTEVMKGLPDDLREFVLKTAVVERFNLALADEICGHEDSHILINRLSSLNALIVPMDNNREWYRYHHLFSECLRDMLKLEDPAEYEAIHRKAAKWCNSKGHLADAIRYANAIKAYDISADVINGNGGWAIAINYSPGYFRGLFADIPEEEVRKDARLMMAKAYICLRSGELKKAVFYCNEAEALVEREGTTPSIEKKRLAICTAIFGRAEVSIQMGDNFLEHRLFQIDPDDHFTRSFVQIVLANEKLVYGDFALTQQYAESALRGLEKVGNRIIMGGAHMAIATAAYYRGKYDVAKLNLQQATDITDEVCGPQNTMKFLSGVGRHAIDYWQGVSPSRDPIALKRELFSILDADGGFDDYAIGFDALVHHAVLTKDYEEAQELIDTLNEVNERYGYDRLTKLAELFQLDLYSSQGQLGDAELVYEKIRRWHSKDGGANEQIFWFLEVMAGYSRARFLSVLGYNESAIELVDETLGIAKNYDIKPFIIRGNLLRAALLDAAGEPERSLNAFITALELAAPMKQVQAFAGDGITKKMAAQANKIHLDHSLSPAARDFLKRISVSSDQRLLTDREEEVLMGLSAGQTNKEIARELDVTENTIKFHLKGLYRKLDVSKRVNAVEKARELRIIS